MTIDPDAMPRRPRETVVHVQNPDGSMTVQTPVGDLVELNSTAAALWALCDGQTSVREIVGAATTFFAGPADTIEHDILATLQQLEQQGMLAH